MDTGGRREITVYLGRGLTMNRERLNRRGRKKEPNRLSGPWPHLLVDGPSLVSDSRSPRVDEVLSHIGNTLATVKGT